MRAIFPRGRGAWGGASVLIANVSHFTFSVQHTHYNAERFDAEEPGRAAGWLRKFAAEQGGAFVSAINTSARDGARGRRLQAPQPETTGPVVCRWDGAAPPATLEPRDGPVTVRYTLEGMAGLPVGASPQAARYFRCKEMVSTMLSRLFSR